MMKNSVGNHDTEEAAAAPGESWARLYDRIRLLALTRAAAMTGDAALEDEPERFDRGARALRTLMSAAEVARRMKEQDAKEHDLNVQTQLPAVSDERIRDIKRRLEAQIDRIEQEDRDAPESSDGRSLSGVS